MGLLELKILLVVILCIPIVLVGIRFIGSLTDAALSGRRKNAKSKKRKKDDNDKFER